MTHNPTEPCYHCGLPVPEHEHWPLQVDDQPREFCCPGCREVCRTLIDAGMGDYYQFRETRSPTAKAILPEVLERLAFFDHPDIQKSFVIDQGALREAELMLEAIRCPACLWLNEQQLRRLDGVTEVEMDYVSHRARVVWDPDRIKLSAILEAITALGYIAHPYDPTERRRIAREQRKRDGQRLIFAGFLGMPAMSFAFSTYVMGGPGADGSLPLWEIIGRWTSLISSLAILGYAAQDFFIGAWRDLRVRRVGMDVPIVIGLLTALAGSVVATITQHGEVYYDSIAMFVFFVLAARLLEKKGTLRAIDALDRLARVIPRSACRLDEQDHEHTVLAIDLAAGDRVRVRPGEIVPGDGRLIEGEGGFDESLLTGESLPVQHATGDRVIGGSVNVEQPCVIEITGAGNDTTLAAIQRLVNRAQSEKPRIALLAQRVAAWFVAAVLTVGSLTAVAWLLIDPSQALHNTVAVLIVTCPCALALATPAALVIAAGRFVDLGLMPLRMDRLETLAAVDTVVFDKTGTLTEGHFRLQQVLPEPGWDGADWTEGRALDRARALAAALEQGSEHPLARAFIPYATGLAATGLRNHPGAGVSGEVDGLALRLGRPEFALAQPDTVQQRRITELRDQGLGVLALTSDDRLLALFALSDGPRDSSGEAVARLQAMGIGTAVISGDHATQVARLAEELGISEAFGDLRPDDKLAWLKQRAADGGHLAMVGDGINDAPVLAGAHCAIAMGAGTELAQSHSDFLLLHNDLGRVPAGIALARRTRAVIRQNLVWALIYNLCAIPAAALGYIPPWGAAIGMSLSSLAVVGNALRLARVKG